MISEEEKKELEELKSLLYRDSITQYGKRKLINLYENLMKTQNKMIELMADILSNLGRYDYEGYFKEDVIEEIRKKVEDEKDNTNN